MKRYISILTILLSTTFCISAQEKQEKSAAPNIEAKAAFQKQFPGATKVKWEKEKGDYEVNFLQKGTEMSAVYDTKGLLKETESSITVAELPSSVSNYLQQHYKGQKVKEAAKIKKADGSINYEAEVNKSDLLFDASGKFIKIAKD